MQYLDEKGVQPKSADNKPGKEFIFGFEKRHPEITRTRDNTYLVKNLYLDLRRDIQK